MCRWFRFEVCSSDNTFPHDLESLHKCREAGMKSFLLYISCIFFHDLESLHICREAGMKAPNWALGGMQM